MITQPSQEDDVSLCGNCGCMTHTVTEHCGKCGALKSPTPNTAVVSDEIREQLNRLMYLVEPYMNRAGVGLDEDWQEFIAEVQKTDTLITQYGNSCMIAELKRLWNTTQPDLIPQGVPALDMSEELHNRVAELTKQGEE